MKVWQKVTLTVVLASGICFWIGGEVGFSSGYLYGWALSDLSSAAVKLTELKFLQVHKPDQVVQMLNQDIDAA